MCSNTQCQRQHTVRIRTRIRIPIRLEMPSIAPLSVFFVYIVWCALAKIHKVPCSASFAYMCMSITGTEQISLRNRLSFPLSYSCSMYTEEESSQPPPNINKLLSSSNSIELKYLHHKYKQLCLWRSNTYIGIWEMGEKLL